MGNVVSSADGSVRDLTPRTLPSLIEDRGPKKNITFVCTSGKHSTVVPNRRG